MCSGETPSKPPVEESGGGNQNGSQAPHFSFFCFFILNYIPDNTIQLAASARRYGTWLCVIWKGSTLKEIVVHPRYGRFSAAFGLLCDLII